MGRKKEKDASDQEDDESLDAELLALVTTKKKEDSSSKSKKKQKKTKKRKKKHSSESENEYADSSDEEGQLEEFQVSEEYNKGSKETHDVKVPLKKRKNLQPEPAPTQLSDSENEFDDGYDEDLMGDEEDRRRLMSLTEKEREEILADRYNKRKELEARRQIKRQMKDTGRNKAKDAEPPSSSPRRTSKRSKTTDSSKASAFSDLKKKRAKAHVSGPVDDDEEEDDDWDNPESKSKKRQDSDDERNISKNQRDDAEVEKENVEENQMDMEVGKEEIMSITLSRTFLEKKVDEPYFDLIVAGFFVRVGIGKSHEKPVYRLAQIQEVKESSKKYALGKKLTNKYLVLKLGNRSKTFSIEYISNQPPTDTEFNFWKAEMNKEEIPIMSKEDAVQKKQLLREAENYIRTDEDITRMIERNKQLNKIPVNIAAEKLTLLTLRDAARDLNNLEDLERINGQLLELEKLEKEQKAFIDPLDQKAKQINLKNKITNQTQKYENDRGTIDTEHDPFSRRHTKPAFPIFIKSNDNNAKDNAEVSNDVAVNKDKENKPSKQSSNNGLPDAPSNNNNNNASAQNVTKKKDSKKDEIEFGDPDAQLKSIHDFDIDLPSKLDTANDSFIPKSVSGMKHLGVVAANNKRPALSVNDYKVRRGLI